ncbi:UNVERIFIED_CONTAM: hypothetical protein Sindi_1212700, partial [Sesamum indicum]
KLIFNGALLDRGAAMALGVVAQDDRGVCLVWWSCWLVRSSYGKVAEALQRVRLSNLLLVAGGG